MRGLAGTRCGGFGGRFARLAQRADLRLLAVLVRLGLCAVGHQPAREHGAGGRVGRIENVPVERRELDGGVQRGGGGAADEQRRREPAGSHLPAELLHLEERRGDEPADADEVGAHRGGLLQDGLLRDHHAEVGDLETVASQHDAGDVLADVVDIALDRGQQETGLGAAAPLLAHIGLEDLHGVAHHLGGLHDLREEHLAGGEQLAHARHARHQRSLDDVHRAALLLQARQQVLLQLRRSAADEGAGEALLEGQGGRSGNWFFSRAC